MVAATSGRTCDLMEHSTSMRVGVMKRGSMRGLSCHISKAPSLRISVCSLAAVCTHRRHHQRSAVGAQQACV